MPFKLTTCVTDGNWKNEWEVVVAQLVERLLPIPEVRSSNPVIGKNLLNICLLSTVYWKDEKKKKKRPGMAHLKKILLSYPD